MSVNGGLGRVIAIIRLPAEYDPGGSRERSPADSVVRAGEILASAGLTAVEVTLTTPGALEAIEALRAALPSGCLVGAGSVRTPQQAQAAATAGARFLVTPTFKPAVLRATDLPVVCGALTPTEIEAAADAGAALVRVFPAGAFGPGYIKELLAPMPELRLAPTGGVTADNLGAYARSGAVAVGVGSALVRDGDWDGLEQRARRISEAARAAWNEEKPCA